jgi:4-alpha-glucanotransferase
MQNVREKLYHSPASQQWRLIEVRPHHGIVTPLFSLRTQQSCGIGEFPDLIPLSDWMASLRLEIVQLLPLNDTGPETSPYAALSAFALNPLNLGLASLPLLDKMPQATDRLKELQALTHTQRIDYPLLHQERDAFLSVYFTHVGPLILNTPYYQVFLEENSFWLKSYALFKAVKIERQWESWQEWPQQMHLGTPAILSELEQLYPKEIAYHSLLQYLCFQQLTDVKKKAKAHGIYLKGDLPILINRESADVWANPEIFLLDYAAGAPPDFYAAEGQKWGFPLYNWPELEHQRYRWWRERLKTATPLYDLYRIDHIVGFFRIWAIPLDKTAKEGHFIPSDPAQWIPHGEKIMRMMLETCPMLPIGEDLGTVPTEVRQCLKRLGICGTKVMRWERMWNEDRRFIKPEDYPVESMTTVSTHDSETLFLWWRDQYQEAHDYALSKGWVYTPQLSLEYHLKILYESHHSASLFHINLLQEYLTLVPQMGWPEPEDERINIPGVISPRNWSYRFRPFVEEIQHSDRLRVIFHKALGRTL